MYQVNKPILGTPIDGSHRLAKGLVGFWLTNEGGGSKIYDLSGNNNAGTLTTMAIPATAISGWNPSRTGIGLNFDGTSDKVVIGTQSVFDITGDLTVSAWIKTITTTRQTIVGKFNSSSAGFWMLVEATGQIQFMGTVGGGTGNPYWTSGGCDGLWHHIVGVRRANNAYIYADGILRGSRLNGTIQGTTTNALWIGARASNNSEWFNGSIDDVRIYNRPLTANEIMEGYINPYGMFRKTKIGTYSVGVVASSHQFIMVN